MGKSDLRRWAESQIWKVVNWKGYNKGVIIDFKLKNDDIVFVLDMDGILFEVPYSTVERKASAYRKLLSNRKQ